MTRLLHTATATHIGGRSANADAAVIKHTEYCVGAAVVDGIGSSAATCGAAREAAEAAAAEAALGNAQSALMTAAHLIKNFPDEPNAVGAVVSADANGTIEIAHVGDAAVFTWSSTRGLTRWTVDQTVGEHLRYMLAGAPLTDANRATLEQALQHLEAAVPILDDYILNTLADATVPTIGWTVLREESADVDRVLLTSDGVHKPLSHAEIEALAALHQHDSPQVLADEIVLAAVKAGSVDPADEADNATVAVIALGSASVVAGAQ
jgi:serine/threonine protein phosphatase PrpC